MMLKILTPIYNRREVLLQLHNSLKMQTCKDFECVIVDDGSKDNAKEVAKVWLSGSDFLVKYFLKKKAANIRH